MNNIYSSNLRKGFGIVEAIIASAIISVVLVAIISAYQNLSRLSLQNTENIQAAFLLEEGGEIVRIMRDNNWSNISSLTNGTTYYATWNGTTWVSTTTPNEIDVFTRTFVFSNATRDMNFNLSQTEGTEDPNSRLVTVSVSWDNYGNGTTTKSLQTYIFNTFNQ